jgi:hypothetical protein
MVELKGGCHCGNIRIAVQLSRATEAFSPRACDCDFCQKHGAAYISDPAGTLRIEIQSAQKVARYRQGSGTAECLLCGTCGVLVAVTYQAEGRMFATVNCRAIEGAAFGEQVIVSPRQLGVSDRIGRWKELWFSEVAVSTAPGAPPNDAAPE